jgi:hypothetical protein
MKFPLKADWPKMLLTGGLLLILGQGVLQLPEVSSRLWPEKFWGREIRRIQGFLGSTEEQVAKEEATREALLLIRASGFTYVPSGSRPTPLGLLQALKRTEARQWKFSDRVRELGVILQRLERLRDDSQRKP